MNVHIEFRPPEIKVLSSQRKRMVFRDMVTCDSTRKVKFDHRSSQISLQSIDDFAEFSNRTIGRTSRTEVPPPALKNKPKFPYNSNPEPIIIEEDPEVRKRHIMICSFDGC